MTASDSKRLAHIRMEMMKWNVMKPGESESWDNTFLVRLLDEALEEKEELRRKIDSFRNAQFN